MSVIFVLVLYSGYGIIRFAEAKKFMLLEGEKVGFLAGRHATILFNLPTNHVSWVFYIDVESIESAKYSIFPVFKNITEPKI